MRAVRIARFGGPEVLEIVDLPTPRPRRDEVRVAVVAASVNPRDWLIRSGRYVFRFLLPRLPFVPGSDVAGVVEEVGSRVRDVAPGDEVFGMIPTSRGFGGYAEQAVLPASTLAPKPLDVPFAEAAAIPLAGLTALQALRDDGRLRPGERVLVVGAAGGVGHLAVQIAKALGAGEVVAVASGRHEAVVRGLGADVFVDRHRESFQSVIRDVDLLFDAVGRSSLAATQACLHTRARYVTTVPSRAALLASIRSRLSLAGRRSGIVLVRSDGADLRQLATWMARGELRPLLDRVAPLDRVAHLHEHGRTWSSRGKNVLLVRPEAR